MEVTSLKSMKESLNKSLLKSSPENLKKHIPIASEPVEFVRKGIVGD